MSNEQGGLFSQAWDSVFNAKDYEDPKYTKESYDWVKQQVNDPSLAPQKPQGFDQLPADAPERAVYDKALKEHNSPVSRWKRRIDAMMASENPVFQEKALKYLQDYQNRSAAKAYQNRQIDADDDLSWADFQKLSPEERIQYRKYRGFNDPAAIEKQRMLRTAKTAEEYNKLALELGYDKVLDTGTAFVNPLTGIAYDKDIEGKISREKRAESDMNFYNEFEANISANDSAFDTITNTRYQLSDLFDETSFITVGPAGLLSFVPGTDMANWEAARDTIVSRLSLEKMSQLKSDSSTGATGFGQLSEKELKVLQDYLGNLTQSQSKSQIKRNILLIDEQLKKMQKNLLKRNQKAAKRYKRITGNEQYRINPDDAIEVDGLLTDDYLNKTPIGLGTSNRQQQQQPGGKQRISRAELKKYGLSEEEAIASGYEVY